MQLEDDKITIVKANKIELDVRKQMAEVFAEGYTQWLGYFSKDTSKIKQAFAHMFVLDQFYVALKKGEIAGFVACTDGKHSAVKLNKRELREHLGFFKGSMAGIFLKKEFETLDKNPSLNTGYIEFVGTAPEFRGQGVASQIIQYIIENTPYKNYIIDEVADTNIPAMRLYEKLGFKEFRKNPTSKNIADKIGINYFLSLIYVKK